MMFIVRGGGGERRASVSGGEEADRIELDGEETRARLVPLGGAAFRLEAGGRTYDVFIEPASGTASRKDELRVEVGAYPFEISVETELEERLRRSAPPRAEEGVAAAVTAPMPCRISRVLVAAGDTVAAGQGVVVIEAMKMESELKAASAGVVSEVRVAAGRTVAAGEVLLVLA